MFHSRTIRSFVLISALLMSWSGSWAQAGTPHSAITVHVFKSGLFSGMGHNHTVTAPVEHASIDVKNLSAEIVVQSKQLKVADTEVSDSTRTEIQTTMLGPKVLDIEKYPEIRFKSSRIETLDGGRYRVSGTLSLHGANKEITFEVSGGPVRFHGSAKINQTDFGIKPISAAGGTIKVKDQLEIEFEIDSSDFAKTSGAK